MPLPRVQRVVQDQQGNLVPGVLGSVYNQGTGVLAALWNDDAGTLPLSNPMTNDPTYASFKFYIAPGHYDMSFTKPGYTFESLQDFQVTQDVLTLGTMAVQDAGAVAITGGTATGLATLSTLDAGSQAYFAGPTSLATYGSVFAPYRTDTRFRIAHLKASEYGLMIGPSDTDVAGYHEIIFMNVAGSGVGTITTTATSTAYNTSSDARLKHAITALAGALDVVQALRPVAFFWNADGSAGEGFLAHELQQVIPAAVSGEPDAVHDDGSVKPQQVDHSRLVVWLVAAVQELAQQVEALTARVASLETQLGL